MRVFRDAKNRFVITQRDDGSFHIKDNTTGKHKLCASMDEAQTTAGAWKLGITPPKAKKKFFLPRKKSNPWLPKSLRRE